METPSSALHRALLSSLFLIFLLLHWGVTPSQAQSPGKSSQFGKIAIEWTATGKGADAVRARLVQKLNASGKVQIVANAAQADAVLRGTARMWITGYHANSPRSDAERQPILSGFASLELVDKSGAALWSYLATPRLARLATPADDLADQLAQNFLAEPTVRGTLTGNPASAESSAKIADTSGVTQLRGAGGTFPAPIYQKWFESFQESRPNIRVRYDAVGSQQGIERFLSGQTDFGASDMPLSDKELGAHSGKILQCATLLGAVVPIYNLKDVPDSLNFTPEILADIYLGKIKRWNAPEIRAINRSAHLPDEAIRVVHRSDGSGTTFAFTDYLSKVSAAWAASVGAGTTVNWPAGDGAAQNDGVAETVFKTPNSIGYVEYIYALQHELNFGSVRNASGAFVKADLESVTTAAKSVVPASATDFRLSITNAPGKHSYPIATFTWLMVPAEIPDPKKKVSLVDLLQWMLTTGQKQCSVLGYAPLPPELAARELQALAALK